MLVQCKFLEVYFTIDFHDNSQNFLDFEWIKLNKSPAEREKRGESIEKSQPTEQQTIWIRIKKTKYEPNFISVLFDRCRLQKANN